MLNHGFKAVQIGTSAWTAEALKNTMPASVFSRSTECHNQDKVSMGTIAARDAMRVLELTEQVAAATCSPPTRASGCAPARPTPGRCRQRWRRCTRSCWPTSPRSSKTAPWKANCACACNVSPATLEAACVSPGCFTSTRKSSCRS
jgi:hypothetical protein